jgi:hypothetical protein
LTCESGNIIIQIKYKNAEKTFSGSLEEVWLSVNKFFNEFLPSFEISSKLVLHVDLQKLVKECEGIIAFSPEGSNLLVSRNKLTDNETLATLLLANYIGYRLGLLKSDSALKEELQTRLGKSAKIASTRLGELVKNEIATRTADERYKITTFGVTQMQKDILPRIRTKTSNQAGS